MRKLKSILASRYLFKIIFIISILYLIIFNITIKLESKYNKNENEFILLVNEIKKYDNRISITATGKEKIKLTYYYKDKKEVENINIGDTIKVTGILEKPPRTTVPNTFDYQKYLYYNKIFYIIKAQSIIKIKNNTSLIYDIKNKINNKIENLNSSAYLKTFILGDTDKLDKDILNIYYDLGISHLFSISGMHISLIALFILYILNRISYNRFFNYLIVITFLIFYAVLISFPASVFRSIIMYTFFTINNLFNLKIKSFDLALGVFSFAIFINPLIIYNIGFQFSYINSLALITFSYKMKNIKNYFLKALYTSYICFMVSLPICIYNFYEVNFIGIILNVIVIPLVNFIIFPLSILTFIIPFIDYILSFFISILENISLLVNKITITKLVISKPSYLFIFIYYIFIYLMLKNKKHIIYFFILIYIHKNIVYFYDFMNIIFLDVGQGDSIFISYPNNKANILIDTGGNINSTYNLSSNKIVPYLKSIGIDHLDYVIITHKDYDHMGELKNLIKEFKIEQIYFNDLNIDKEYLKIIKDKKIKYSIMPKYIQIDDNKIYNLNNNNYDNENDNSIVLYLNYNNYKLLLMADAGIEVEKQIIKKYRLNNISFLKVGHHGSNSSSNKEFLNKINPKYSIISVGENNRYNHPHKEVLNNLEKSKIFRTDMDGSINIKIKQNKYTIYTYN